MKERERNKRLISLLQKLTKEEDLDSIDLIGTMVKNDTESMQHSFKLCTVKSSITYFLGKNNLGEL